MDSQSQSVDKKVLSDKLEECIESAHTISEEIGTLVENATQYLGEAKKHNYARKSMRIKDSLEEDLRNQLLLLQHELSQVSINFVYASPEMWKLGDGIIESEDSSKEYPGNYSIHV